MNISRDVYDLMAYVESRGFKCYLVGGAVRDILSGKKPKDYDFTSDAKPEDIKAIFEHHIETGIDFGTITVIFRGSAYEITTFRLEHRYSDGRRPDMVFYSDSLYSDLSRRDFTMNAIALDKELNIHDYFGGLEDLKDKLLRTIGRAKVRFGEDRLRKLRAVRISCENGYLIHEDIIKSVKNDPSLAGVSSERIRAELDRIFNCDNVNRGVELLFRLHLMDEIMPELTRKINPHESRWDEYIGILEDSYNDISLREYLILRPLEDFNQIKEIIHRLKFSRRSMRNIHDLWEYEHLTKSEEFLDRASGYSFNLLEIMGQLDKMLNRRTPWANYLTGILENDLPHKVTDLKIGGNDLKSMGFSGPEIGRVLSELLKKCIKDPNLNEKSRLYDMAKEIRGEYK
ncbi:MAG: CCA tRNA nucleotidyltransferase [Eubacteriaceae bacterium]|nr:CCA tRNA nucleotidyltransferase [Eubacteriaceae bacterium]